MIWVRSVLRRAIPGVLLLGAWMVVVSPIFLPTRPRLIWSTPPARAAAAPLIATPGTGVGPVTLGLPWRGVLAAWGEPELCTALSRVLLGCHYPARQTWVFFTVAGDPPAVQVFAVRTSAPEVVVAETTLRVGQSIHALRAALGAPIRVAHDWWDYPGLSVRVEADVIQEWLVSPRDGTET